MTPVQHTSRSRNASPVSQHAPNWSADPKIIQDVSLALLEPDPNNPRSIGSKEAMASLTASVKQRGIQIPLVIRPHETDKTKAIVVAGHRRVRAATEAGLQVVPCILSRGGQNEAEVIEQLLVDNLHREAIPPLDIGLAIKKMMIADRLTQSQVAAKLHLSQPYVSQILSVLNNLPESAHRHINMGTIPFATAVLIAKLPEDQRPDACVQVIAGQLTAEQLKTQGTGRKKPPARPREAQNKGALQTNEHFEATNGVSVRILCTRAVKPESMIRALEETIEAIRSESEK